MILLTVILQIAYQLSKDHQHLSLKTTNIHLHPEGSLDKTSGTGQRFTIIDNGRKIKAPHQNLFILPKASFFIEPVFTYHLNCRNPFCVHVSHVSHLNVPAVCMYHIPDPNIRKSHTICDILCAMCESQ